jgi:ribonuclease R
MRAHRSGCPGAAIWPRVTETDGPEAGSVEGTIDIIASGAGYARLGPGLDDVYVPERAVGTALHGDRVLVRHQTGGRGRPEGRVLQVLERRRIALRGHGGTPGPNWWSWWRTTNDAPPVRDPGGGTERCRGRGQSHGHRAGRMEGCPGTAAGSVERVLGKAGEHDVEMHAILAEFDLPVGIPRKREEGRRRDPRGGCTQPK